MNEKIEKLKNESIFFEPKPKSIAYIGDKYYRTELPVDKHFNWFQKLMWRLCFGVSIVDCIGE